MSDLLLVLLTPAFVFSVLRVTTPLLLAALGGLVADLSGALNLALEGSMLAAAFCAVLVGAWSGSSWWGLAAGVAAGAAVALVLGWCHLVLGADLVLAGLACNIAASGGTIFLLAAITGERGVAAGLRAEPLPALVIPGLAAIPGLGEALSGHHLLTYTAWALVPIVAWVVRDTVWGLRLRAVGESAAAAATAGVPVRRVQWQALAISGALAGLAGVNLSLGYLTFFSRDMTAGRGYIALGAILLGGRTAWGTAAGALLFGLADALGNQLQTAGLPAQLVLTLPYAATVVALVVYPLLRRAFRPGAGLMQAP